MAKLKSEKEKAPSPRAISAPDPEPAEAPASSPRVYRGTQVVDHDLFKLRVSTMVKNVSYTEMPVLERIEHCHIFHTIDSNGKKQDSCSSVGGHHHAIEVVAVSGHAPTLRVSPPLRYVRQKIKGRYQRVAVPVGNDEDGTLDDHTHEVEYLGSEKIKLRESNIEAAKVIAGIKAHQEPQIDGVLPG